MKRLAYLLTQLAEEASEVSLITLKAQQFGLAERYNQGPTNAERIQEELTDLVTLVDMLNDEFGTTFQLNPCDVKRAKVDHWYEYSLRCHAFIDGHDIAVDTPAEKVVEI